MYDLTKQKRNAVMYVRIKEINKKFIEDFADSLDVSASILVDCILDEWKKVNAGKRRKIKRSIK